MRMGFSQLANAIELGLAKEPALHLDRGHAGDLWRIRRDESSEKCPNSRLRPSRPQQATPGWRLGIAPTPLGSRRCCARGRAHSDPLRLRRAAPSAFKENLIVACEQLRLLQCRGSSAAQPEPKQARATASPNQ